jgi:glycosyltransferase involved in cell wall biosynthesis
MMPGTDDKPGEGIKRHVYEISRRLGKAGFEVVNVVPYFGKSLSASYIDDSYFLLKVPVTNLQWISIRSSNIERFLESALYYISCKEAARKLLNTLDKSRIIHTHGFHVVLQPSTRSHFRRVATLHGFVPVDIMTKEKAYAKAITLNCLLKKIYKNADVYTACSDLIRSLAAKFYGIKGNKISVVPHGVDTNFFSANPSSHEVASIEARFKLDRPYRILFVGQLDKGKRPEVLLQAMRILSSKRKDVLLIIRSSWGDYYSETLRLVRELDLKDAVRLIGEPVYGTDLRALYKVSHAFANMAHMVSGVSTALLEAMASGIPPIIYKGSTSRGIVDESNGIILNELSPMELASAMETLIEDQVLARRLSHNAASKMLREYDWDTVVVPRYISVYNNLSQA